MSMDYYGDKFGVFIVLFPSKNARFLSFHRASVLPSSVCRFSVFSVLAFTCWQRFVMPFAVAVAKKNGKFYGDAFWVPVKNDREEEEERR